MTITSTGVAVTIAVVIALAFLFFGPVIFAPFAAAPAAAPAAALSQGSGSSTPADSDGSVGTSPAAMNGIPQNPTQLEMNDVKVGTGATAEAGDTVTVEYVGSLTDGTVFDASKNHQPGTFTFTLGGGQVIQGWDQGIVGMKEGGERTLVIPASLGYGAQSVGSIPPNSTLVFQVQLDKVQKGK